MTENYNIISRPVRLGDDYWDCDFGPLYLRCDEGNPGALYESIEFTQFDGKNGSTGLVGLQADNVVFDNISFRCNGNSYIKNAGNNFELVANTVIQNCEFAYGACGAACYEGHKDGNYTVVVQGDGVYGIIKNARFENNYFHDTIMTTTTYEADMSLTGYLSGSYRILNNVMLNTMGIRLDSSSNYLQHLDSVEVRGNLVWNTGRMDGGKYHYSEGSIFLPPNHYGECIIEENIFYTTENGHESNALLNIFINKNHHFEIAGFTRPVIRNNTYVQHAGRDFAFFGNENQEHWSISDSDLLTKAAELLGDTTSEFYVIERNE